MIDRTVNDLNKPDIELDEKLRPKSFDGFFGQTANIERLKLFIQAAKGRNDVLDHVLLIGPPGLGKTTLARIIAYEMNSNFISSSGPVLDRALDLSSILSKLEHNDIFFIDEIHRLNNNIEEVLYSAMEDFNLDIIMGTGPAARSVKIELPSFTLVGATTRAGIVSSPLRDRFGVMLRFEYYSDKELHQILQRSASIFQIEYDTNALMEIAKRSRGTPRIANRLLKRIRDYAQVKYKNIITLESAKTGLEFLGIDKFGLDEMDRTILKILLDNFGGGPAGVKNIAVSIGESVDTIESVYEPFLIKKGFIQRTPTGRKVTEKTISMFNKFK